MRTRVPVHVCMCACAHTLIGFSNFGYQTHCTRAFSGIDRPPTTRKPGSRRESKKTWKIDHSHEKKAAGMKDEPMLKGDDNSDEQIDFQSATASSVFHRHLFTNLGITAMTAILAGSLST